MLLIRSVAVPGTDLPVILQTQVGHAYDESTVARDVLRETQRSAVTVLIEAFPPTFIVP